MKPCTHWEPQGSPTLADVARFDSHAGKSSTKGKSKSATSSGPRFATEIQPSEWTGTPVVSTTPKVQKALTDGEDLPGKLIVTKDLQAADEVASMFHAFGCEDKSPSVAIADPPGASGPSVCVW